MGHFLPFFKEEDLIDHNLSVQAGLEMKFQDKHLVRCLAFAKHRRRLAINICQKDIAAGIFCVLTESDTHFTIWREQPSENQTVRVETTPTLQPRLNQSHPPPPTKAKRISSQIEEVESVYLASPAVTATHYLATDLTPHTIETTVELMDTSSQAITLQHKSTLTAARTETFDIVSTPRSAFLSLLNQELTQHIGPMADYLINVLLAERPNIKPQQMIEAIVAEISDPNEAQIIQKSLERVTDNFLETMLNP